MVLHHERYGFARQHPMAIELAAIEEHLCKPQIVGNRRQKSRAAGQDATGFGELFGKKRRRRHA
jgi:hypothetical protein